MSKRSQLNLILLASILLYFALWPTGTDPVAWDAPTPPELSGVYEQNTKLEKAEKIGIDVGSAGEDVAIDKEGRIYTGYNDGRIMRFDPDGQNPEELVNTQGRPLGLDFDNNGYLIIADADRGLLSLSPNKELKVLSLGTDSHKLVFADDVDVAPDGQIYFSDASAKFDRHHLKQDFIEHQPHGLLLNYNPETKTTRIMMRDLYFANGIAVSPDNTFLLVVETSAYRVRKVWLDPNREPRSEIIIDNLPGMPDGISAGSNGKFWLPLVSPRNALLDKLSQSPKLREVLLRFPTFLQPKIVHYSFVLSIDENGKVLDNLQGQGPESIGSISSVEEWGPDIYLGSIGANFIARLKSP